MNADHNQLDLKCLYRNSFINNSIIGGDTKIITGQFDYVTTSFFI